MSAASLIAFSLICSSSPCVSLKEDYGSLYSFFEFSGHFCHIITFSYINRQNLLVDIYLLIYVSKYMVMSVNIPAD